MNTERRPAFDPYDAMSKPYEVRDEREKGTALLVPESEVMARSGGFRGGEALIPDLAPGNGLSQEQRALELYLIDTLESPDTIATGASQLRLEAAAKVGILQPAIDAAETARAGNSLEKMLCHQLAALHHASMTLMARAVGGSDLMPPDAVLQTRLMNAAARQMETYQSGILALLKFKTGGKQQVVVQHVTVSEGGQAVIAGGNVGAGGRGGRGGMAK